jgi:hypothetical protein
MLVNDILETILSAVSSSVNSLIWMKISLCFFVAKQSLHLVVSNRTYLYLISSEKWQHFGKWSRKSSLILLEEMTQDYQIIVLLIFKFWHKPMCSFPKLFEIYLGWRVNLWVSWSSVWVICNNPRITQVPEPMGPACLLLHDEFAVMPSLLLVILHICLCILGKSLPYLLQRLPVVKLLLCFPVITNDAIGWVYL